MGRETRKAGTVGILALAASILIVTVCFAAPNAGTIGKLMLRFAGFALPPGLISDFAPEKNDTLPDENETDLLLDEDEQIPPDILQLEASFRAAGEAAGSVREHFYSTDGSTDLVGNIAIKNATKTLRPDFSQLLADKPEFRPSSDREPLVLIYHTHTTESYQRADTGFYYSGGVTRSEDPAVNMVRIGDALCEVLESSGIPCVHDTQIYDGQYNGAYARSRESVIGWLDRYPSIQIALDVHRDSIGDPETVFVKPTAQIGGMKTAQIMILAGAEEGSVTDFPNWKQNLNFALCLHERAQTMFPGLMRPLYFCPRKYNMDLVPCGLLLEVGSDANTLKEAYCAARLFGRALAALINEKSE